MCDVVIVEADDFFWMGNCEFSSERRMVLSMEILLEPWLER